MLQRLATKTMISKGYTQLLNLNQAKIPYQNTVLASRRDQMAANPKLYDSFIRAVVEGYAYVFNKENKQSVKEVLARNLRLPNPDAAKISTQRPLRNSIANPIRRSKEPKL